MKFDCVIHLSDDTEVDMCTYSNPFGSLWRVWGREVPVELWVRFAVLFRVSSGLELSCPQPLFRVTFRSLSTLLSMIWY